MRPARLAKNPINYKQTKDYNYRKPSSDDALGHKDRRHPSDSSTAAAPAVETTDSESDPRTDCINPAKSTLLNEERAVKGGPCVGMSSSIDHAKCRRNFCGAPVEAIKDTFKNTTQLGRIGAVQA